jgi:hypothetical protein
MRLVFHGRNGEQRVHEVWCRPAPIGTLSVEVTRVDEPDHRDGLNQPAGFLTHFPHKRLLNGFPGLASSAEA